MLDRQNPNRRKVISSAAWAGAALVLVPFELSASPVQVEDEIKKLFAGRPMEEGKIKLDLPSIAESGLVVPLAFDVESPMTAADYVKRIVFFSEGNPNPVIAAYHFTPLIPKAAGQMRIRLAQTQNVVAVTEMSNGKLFRTQREVKVTIGGCGG